MVRRSTFLPVILTLMFCVGCGESKPATTAHQATAEQASTGNRRESSSLGEQSPRNDPPSEVAVADQAAPEETALEEATGSGAAATAVEDMPEEEQAAQKTTIESTAAAVTADETGNMPEPADETTRSRKPAGSGKLLRGLASSFGRALSKVAGAEDFDAEVQPAPDPADDPFPDGEPAEVKSKEESK